ncbi:Single-stranded DNA-binding protein [Companilactobacillus paralimentarius]
MINRSVLVGRLTRDPELKRTANDVAVVSFTLAVNRRFTNSQGNVKPTLLIALSGERMPRTLLILPTRVHLLELMDAFKHVTMKTNKAKEFM